MYRNQLLATTLSALYGKLLVVMGIAFPMAEVISTYIPPSFYEVMNFRPRTHAPNSLQTNKSITNPFAGILFVFVRWQYVVSVVYVCHDYMGSTEAFENGK